MTVIELGDVTSGSEQPRPANSPNGYERRLLRRVAVALVAALCLVTIAASERPEPSRALRPLWAVDFGEADRFSVTPDAVYTGRPDPAGQLQSRDLATGAIRWTFTLPDPTAWPSFDPDGEVVLVPYGRFAQEVKAADGTTYFNEFYRNTIALDARTGQELWRRPGEVYQATRDRALLTDRNATGVETSALHLVRLSDGAVVWERTGLHAERVTAGGAAPSVPESVITVTATGAVEVLRWADGVRMSAGRIAWYHGSPDSGPFTDLAVDAARLYVSLAGSTTNSVTAYDIATFHRLWRISGTNGSAYPCGTLICGLDPEGVVAYDAATGAVRWHSPGIRNAWPAGRGRLVADANDRWRLIDEATGRQLADLGDGNPAFDLDGGLTFMVRPTVAPRGNSAVGRVDARTGAVGIRGAIEWVTDGTCQATGDYLVCATPFGRLTVTLVG
jgi:outer membrane protein assembly factor BamB